MLILLAGITVAQETPRWNDPSTAVMATGNYTPLPNTPAVTQVTFQPRRFETPQGVYLAYPNIRVVPTSWQQTEVPLVISRNTPNLMFGSSNATSGSSINSGSYMSTNSGTTWFGYDYINNGNTNNQRGDPGPAWCGANRLIFTHLSSTVMFGSVTGMQAEYSTNYGQNFSASYQVQTLSTADKNLAGGDEMPTSPYYGYCYMSWCNYSAGITFIARTTNGGVSWDAPISHNPPSGLYGQGHDVCVGPGGRVIATWANHGPSSPWTETSYGVGYSTNGGASYTWVDPAFTGNGTRSTSFNGWGIRTNGFPRIAVDRTSGARSGWVYIVVSQYNLAPAGSDADVVLHRSTDGGATWSAGIRVNQDAMNNGKVQWFPCVCVDENGGVNVAYYDNRNFPSYGDSCSVFISRSLDGGNTWTDVEVADHHFRPKNTPGLGGGYMGDYIGIAAGNGKVWAFWMDDKLAYPTFQAMAGYIISGAPPAHDIIVGPWLSFPSQFVAGTAYTMRTKVTNGGTSSETNVPIKWWVNSVLTNTTNLNMTPGKVDSVSNSWTPAAAGNYTLMYCSGLSNDENRNNDTIRTTVTVLPSGTQIKGATVCRNNVNKYLPDNSTVRDTLIYNDPIGLTLVDVNVKIDTFYHTWTGDVAFQISHLGSSDALITNRGGSGDNVIGCTLNDSASTPISSGSPPFTGSFRPESPLSVFNTLNVNGAWILVMTDNASGDTGLLKAWCLQLTYYTLVGGIKTVEIPNYYSLQQNYPNPFNPVTTITYTLPSAGDVKLVVYDMLGRVVRTLVNEKKDVGVYRQEFDAMNLASGIYFYKIEITDGANGVAFTDVKRMALLK
jgi:hypothetical protein